VTAVLFVDLDRFKQVNDHLGHQAGDTLLAVACRRIQSSLRSTESAGRLGGDEVGVLCPALESRRDAVRLAERIMAALAEPFTIHDEIVCIGASIGVACSDGDPPAAAELVNQADRAMYLAKKQGRARCVVFGSNDEPIQRNSSRAQVDTSLAHVAVSVARDQRQIDELWDQSIDVRDERLAERLSQVSRALHAADMALSGDDTIG
jgi:diguanylate cyclase (GGDEF)-like protein